MENNNTVYKGVTHFKASIGNIQRLFLYFFKKFNIDFDRSLVKCSQITCTPLEFVGVLGRCGKMFPNYVHSSRICRSAG